jgi:hypothetical protein
MYQLVLKNNKTICAVTTSSEKNLEPEENTDSETTPLEKESPQQGENLVTMTQTSSSVDSGETINADTSSSFTSKASVQGSNVVSSVSPPITSTLIPQRPIPNSTQYNQLTSSSASDIAITSLSTAAPSSLTNGVNGSTSGSTTVKGTSSDATSSLSTASSTSNNSTNYSNTTKTATPTVTSNSTTSGPISNSTIVTTTITITANITDCHTNTCSRACDKNVSTFGLIFGNDDINSSAQNSLFDASGTLSGMKFILMRFL